MDVKQMQVGTTLLLPCFVDGCLLSIGDVHFAQGDGEVSGTALEMDATVTVKLQVRRGMGAEVTQPQFEGGRQLKRLAPSRFHATVGFPLKQAGVLTQTGSEQSANPLPSSSTPVAPAISIALS